MSRQHLRMTTKRYATSTQLDPAFVPVRSFVAADAEAGIRAALQRSTGSEPIEITVTGADTRLTLHGTVHSWAEFRTAGDVAWSTPGVTEVDNQLEMRLNPRP